MADARPSRLGHSKIPGHVSEVHGSRWWAILRHDEGDLIAEMRDPLPPGRSEGSLFTVHRTKRGRVYLYWPPLYVETTGKDSGHVRD